MKVIMTKKEFMQLRDIIININNENVTREFNTICTDKNPHIDTATTTETITFTVSEELSTDLGKVLITHSKDLGKNLNISLTGLPKIISQAKKLFADLGATVKKPRK